MQLQQFGPEARRDNTLEQIESGALPPKETARMMLRAADHEITGMRSTIETLRSKHSQTEEPDFMAQLMRMNAELDTAGAELRDDISAALAPPELGKQPSSLFGGAPLEGSVFDSDEIDFNNLGGSVEKTIAPEAPTPEKVGAEAVLDGAAANFNELERLITENSPDLEKIRTELEANVGKHYCERIMNDAAYRQELGKLQSSLEQRAGMKGPQLCAERSLQNLVVIHETLGPEAASIATSLDLYHYGINEEGLPHTSEQKSVITMGSTYFTPDGFSSLSVNVAHRYSTHDRNYGPLGASASVQREFTKSMRTNAKGELAPHLEAKHEVFELPTALEGNGVASRLLGESLTHYDRIGADEISLKADINIGSYAWASYGFGWNPDNTGEEEISEVIDSASKKIQAALATFGEAVTPQAKEQILSQLENAKHNPLAVTPQFLAGLGKDLPPVRRGFAPDGKTVAYYSEEEFQRQSKQQPKIVDPKYEKAMHLGKIGMLENAWNASIPLKGAKDDPSHPRHLLNKKVGYLSNV